MMEYKTGGKTDRKSIYVERTCFTCMYIIDFIGLVFINFQNARYLFRYKRVLIFLLILTIYL